MTKTYFEYRKSLYGSINGQLGALIKLSKSKLLKKNELELLIKTIECMKELSQCIKENNMQNTTNIELP